MTEGRTQSQTDFDLHGLVGIRALDGDPDDVAVLERQLGPIRAPLDREPDITVRFVDRVAPGSRLVYLGVDDAAFTDDAFLVLRSKHKARAMVQIPFEELGTRPEIVCERGLPAVPLLIPIVNLTALANGALPLHASAFKYAGAGVVCTGWSKGGKTEALLAFVANGAEYIGDEWVYVSADGERVYGIPEPIRVWSWHLEHLPKYREALARGERARLGALRALESVDRALPRAGSSRTRDRALSLVRRQLHVDAGPARLFGDLGPLSGPFDVLFFVASHDSPEITVEPIAPLEVARRMVFSLLHERLDLMEAYLKFRFAFPDRSCPLIEEAAELQRERLERLLPGKRAYAVRHPYPFPIPALVEAMSPFCE